MNFPLLVVCIDRLPIVACFAHLSGVTAVLSENPTWRPTLAGSQSKLSDHAISPQSLCTSTEVIRLIGKWTARKHHKFREMQLFVLWAYYWARALIPAWPWCVLKQFGETRKPGMGVELRRIGDSSQSLQFTRTKMAGQTTRRMNPVSIKNAYFAIYRRHVGQIEAIHHIRITDTSQQGTVACDKQWLLTGGLVSSLVVFYLALVYFPRLRRGVYWYHAHVWLSARQLLLTSIFQFPPVAVHIVFSVEVFGPISVADSGRASGSGILLDKVLG